MRDDPGNAALFLMYRYGSRKRQSCHTSNTYTNLTIKSCGGTSPIVSNHLTPTHTPTPTIVPTHAPQQTQLLKPTSPPCQATNGNPWCYNFLTGKLIYYPPSGFCTYFACIPTFVEPDDPGDGYIVQCGDGLFSQSRGERGACSHHGGVSRLLCSH